MLDENTACQQSTVGQHLARHARERNGGATRKRKTAPAMATIAAYAPGGRAPLICDHCDKPIAGRYTWLELDTAFVTLRWLSCPDCCELVGSSYAAGLLKRAAMVRRAGRYSTEWQQQVARFLSERDCFRSGEGFDGNRLHARARALLRMASRPLHADSFTSNQIAAR